MNRKALESVERAVAVDAAVGRASDRRSKRGRRRGGRGGESNSTDVGISGGEGGTNDLDKLGGGGRLEKRVEGGGWMPREPRNMGN